MSASDETIGTPLQAGSVRTFGENLIGSFPNPNKDDKVGKVKCMFSELVDMLKEEQRNREHTEISTRIFDHAIGEIINAQMCAVKYLTSGY
jgi:hypothetical protein